MIASEWLTLEPRAAALCGVALVAGLSGTVHCAGMCGPLVVGVAHANGGTAGVAVAHQFGRLVGYVALGTIAGALGANGMVRDDAAVGAKWLPLVLGSVLVVMGLLEVIGQWRVSSGGVAFSRLFGGVVRYAMRRALAVPSVVRPVVLGAMTSVLPCGLLHATVLAAVGGGSAWIGATILGSFFLGTLPGLAVVAAGSTMNLGTRFPRLAVPAFKGVLLIAAGLITMVTWNGGDPPCCGERP